MNLKTTKGQKHEPCQLLVDADAAVNLVPGDTILASADLPDSHHPLIETPTDHPQPAPDLPCQSPDILNPFPNKHLPVAHHPHPPLYTGTSRIHHGRESEPHPCQPKPARKRPASHTGDKTPPTPSAKPLNPEILYPKSLQSITYTHQHPVTS